MNRKHYLVWFKVQLSGTDEVAISNDIMKVQDIHRCVQERPGRDHYEILVANGEWEARLTPDDNTMQYSQELHEKLEALLGNGMVETTVLN
jgi:DNA polymerase-3 subunit alpha